MVLYHGLGSRRGLGRDHFDIAILVGDDLEGRLIGRVVVAGDGDIFALGEDEEGKAPIISRITSPPGVSTEKLVLASASPPGALTSFRVMAAARWRSTPAVSLPACTLHVGADVRIGRDARARRNVHQIRDDMIGAFRQAFRRAGLEIGNDQLGFGVVMVGQIDRVVEPRRRDRGVAEAGPRSSARRRSSPAVRSAARH